MSSKYTSTASDKRYIGQSADVTYNAKPCIHAEQCVHRLSEVFDSRRRPWINADGAPVSEIEQAVRLCPSGALHLDRKDGSGESAPPENECLLWIDGPLQFQGNLDIEGATVDLHGETRATLCRCGESVNKPFCDNTHRTSGFHSEDAAPVAADPAEPVGGKLRILPQPNGPLRLEGNVKISNAAGETIFVGSEIELCRCGHSASKPFCDGTHETIGFQAD